MKKINVVLLGYKAYSGKDTVFNIIEDNYYPDVRRKAFADRLKTTVGSLYNLTYDQLHGNKKDIPDTRYPNLLDIDDIKSNSYVLNLSSRRILQTFAQDQRKIYPEIWADILFRDIDNSIDKICDIPCQMSFFITDFRFKNEYDYAKRWEYTVKQNVVKKVYAVKIDRNTSRIDKDISENQLNTFDKWDHIIDNNGSIEDLETKALQLYNNILF